MRRRFILAYVAPVMLLLGLAMLPLMVGSRTFYLRDIATTHTQVKLAQASLLRAGRLPLVDPFRGGQPLVGNPNTVSLYPDNLLYLVAPVRWALSAHIWLHLLLAPCAMFGLARAFALRRPAAWAAGTVYATAGFSLSHANLYNSIATLALAPALSAAAVRLARRPAGRPARRRAAWMALLVALLVLGGDPPSAALALVLAASAALVAGWHRPRTVRLVTAGWMALAAVLGLAVAAPQVIELARIAGVSFRGAARVSPHAALAQSLDPRASVEWLMPLVFGAPDRNFWGARFFGGNEPLYLSLFPGVLALALLLAAGRPRTRANVWAWGVISAGGFVAFGVWNPLVRWAVGVLGSGGLRYPIKAWLWVAIGASLLAGLGFDRLRAASGQRRVAVILGAWALGYLTVWRLLAQPPAGLLHGLLNLMPARPDGAAAALERWTALAFLLFVLVLTEGLIVLLARRHAAVSGASLLVLHAASQLFFLAPLLDTDSMAFYQQPPALLRAVPATPWVVHGRTGNLFTPAAARATRDPDARTVWDEHRRYASLAPQAGVAWGRRYAFDASPEGLDTFWSVAVGQAVHGLEDLDRLRILEAFGVATLILDRPLAPPAVARTALLAQRLAAGQPTWVYHLVEAAPPVGVVSRTHYSSDPNDTLATLRREDFDPREAVVLTGRGRPRQQRPGRLDLVEEDPERVTADVDSPDGTVLLIQRAWLPIYRATIDGQTAPVLTANLARIAVDVPPGLHRVRVWANRRPFYAGWLLACASLVALLVLGFWRQRSPRRQPVSAR